MIFFIFIEHNIIMNIYCQDSIWCILILFNSFLESFPVSIQIYHYAIHVFGQKRVWWHSTSNYHFNKMLFIIYDELSIVISKISYIVVFFFLFLKRLVLYLIELSFCRDFFQLTVDCKYKIYTLTVIINTKLTTGQLFWI